MHIQCSVPFTHMTPGHWICSFMYHFNSLFGAYSTAAISALGTNRTHLCPTRYSFTPESSEAYEGKVPCPRKHRNNVPILKGEKHTISLKILHQEGFERHWQNATLQPLRHVPLSMCVSRSCTLSLRSNK